MGIHFTHDLKWKTHCSKRLDQAEAAWECISRLGTSRGGLAPTAWRQVYTSSIRAIATYGWELGHTDQAMERLRKLQYQAVRKVTGAYHGSRQETLENIAKIEPVRTKVWDMQVRATARILEKGSDLIAKTAETRNAIGGRDWKGHSAAWIPVKKPHFNTCLEENLATIGENGEREISWNFNRETRTPHAITTLELDTKDTPKAVWDTRIRELEEEGWTTCYTDGSGLDNKGAGAFTRSSHTALHGDRSGSRYLGTRATHFDRELSGIVQALEESRDVNLLAILTDSKPAISAIGKLDSGTSPPRSEIEAQILTELCRRKRNNLDTSLAWIKGHKGME